MNILLSKDERDRNSLVRRSGIWEGMADLYYRPQRSWAKVMFLQASVILSTGGGVCLSACWDASPPGPETPPRDQRPTHSPSTPPDQADTPPTRQTPPGPETPPPWTRQTLPGTRDPPQTRQTPWDQRPTPRDQRPPLGSRRQHTVNERPLRILLECILVLIYFAEIKKYGFSASQRWHNLPDLGYNWVEIK